MNDTKVNDPAMNPRDNTGTNWEPIIPNPYMRLQVMMSIQHPEEYYRQAARSLGMVPESMQHDEICAFSALLKSVEADILIQTANEQDAYVFTDNVQRRVYDYITARMDEPTLQVPRRSDDRSDS